MLNKYIHSADIRQIVVKIKTKCLMHFDLMPGSLSTQDTTLWQIFFSNLYLFNSIFSIIISTNRLHGFDEEICFSDNCCYKNG